MDSNELQNEDDRGRGGTVTDMALNEVMCVVAAEEYTEGERRRANLSGKASNMQARYWSYLFDNLHRAVDEIYCTCEADESIIECQEVIMTLDVCKRDFEGLIKQIEIQTAFQSVDDEKPYSVAWEVRRSPNKAINSFASFVEQQHQQRHKRSPSSGGGAVGEATVSLNDSIQSNTYSNPEENNRTYKSLSPREGDWSNGTTSPVSASMGSDKAVSWADRSSTPPPLSPAKHRETRSPGRIVQLHQKLSSPIHKRSSSESIKLLEDKQVKAQQHRNKMKQARALRAQFISEKIDGVKQCHYTRAMKHKQAMEGKLVKAEKLRELRLQEIVRKAHEEDAKVNEIAFITTLEAQNKKMEVLEKHQVVEARLQDKEEERLKKKEENLAKKETVQERKKAIEAERKAKLLELDQKRREQDAKIELKKVERDRQREEMAKERERRIEAIHAALLSSTEQLEKKIQQKHDKSSKLYDQQLEQKKEKAMSASLNRSGSSDYAPRVDMYKQKKWCSVCNIKIVSEVYLMSHLKGKKHKESLIAKGVQTDDVMSVITLAPEEIQRQTVSEEVEERLKMGKKRMKKLRQRMSSRMRENDPIQSINVNSKHLTRFTKLIKDVNRLMDNLSKQKHLEVHQINHLERTLGELNRTLSSKLKEDQVSYCQSGGLASLSRLILLYLDSSLDKTKSNDIFCLSLKSLYLSLSIIELTCTDNVPNSEYFILSHKFSSLVDVVSRYFLSSKDLDVPSGGASGGHRVTWVNVCAVGLKGVAIIISNATRGSLDQQLLKDCISYIVCNGIIDRIAEYFATITGPFDDLPTTQLVMSALNMLTASTASLHFDIKNVFSIKPEDPTLLVCALRQTELAGILSLVYALLLHKGPPRHSSIPPLLPSHIISITTTAIKAINNMAILALSTVQNCLSSEGISLELRHVLSYLLWYCTSNNHELLLHELILAVGYFSVLHHENQMFLLAGRSPTLLQLLCSLPFEYFSDPKLTKLLYPTLISACYNAQDNKAILEVDLNSQLLCSYLENQISEACLANSSSGIKDDRACNFLAFEHRFPKMHWDSALLFFSQKM